MATGLKPGRKGYALNVDFFKRWSPDMAYILGLIVAEGHIPRDGRGLNLPQNDEAYLTKIRDRIGYTGPLLKSDTTWRLLICRKEMTRALADRGILWGPSSGRIRVPKDLKYERDFIRGYFDGDGYVGWRRVKSKYYLEASFASKSIRMLEDVLRIVPTKGCGPKTHSNNWQIVYNGRYAKDLRDWMYNGDSDLALRRKLRIFYQPRPEG